LPPTTEARCFLNETFAFAEHLCAINGARLCTKFELETVAKGTGEWVGAARLVTS